MSTHKFLQELLEIVDNHFALILRNKCSIYMIDHRGGEKKRLIWVLDGKSK